MVLDFGISFLTIALLSTITALGIFNTAMSYLRFRNSDKNNTQPALKYSASIFCNVSMSLFSKIIRDIDLNSVKNALCIDCETKVVSTKYDLITLNDNTVLLNYKVPSNAFFVDKLKFTPLRQTTTESSVIGIQISSDFKDLLDAYISKTSI
jgi:hypothetical protein